VSISAARTIVLPVTRPIFAIYDGVWPVARPDDNLDYSIDATAPLVDAGDVLTSLSLAIAPSGAGELTCSAVTVTDSIITAQLAGGLTRQPGYDILVIGDGASGRVWQWMFRLTVGQVDAAWPGEPPSYGYGTPVTWTSGETPYIFPPSLAGAPATNLILTSPPLLIASQTNIIASAPPGTAAILPTNVIGTIFIQNNDPTNNAPIQPPLGWQINALGLNDPFIIGANGGRISFVTNGISSQYWAG
jgi:hypothetical protein